MSTIIDPVLTDDTGQEIVTGLQNIATKLDNLHVTATNVSYDNSLSSLVATNVQNAIDSLEGISGKSPRIGSDGTWEVWDASQGAYVSTGVSVIVNPPMVAATVSAMTNHDQVYIYTGSETGYQAGYWYYWDGTAWTAGGAYQSAPVDPTLSVAGAAADSKATGDKIQAIVDEIEKQTDNTRNLVDIDAALEGKTYEKSGDTYTFKARDITGTALVSNLEAKVYTVSIAAKTTNTTEYTPISNGLTIKGVGVGRSDNLIAFGRGAISNEWRVKTYTLDNSAGIYTAITLNYSNGSNDYWSVKEIQIEESPEATPYVPPHTLVDYNARWDIKTRIGSFVTPEMFGAVGDGVTDDTAAIQFALNSGNNVFFDSSKRYYISDSLVIPNITPASNRIGRTIFSVPGNWAPYGLFVIGFSGETKPVFDIREDGITLFGLCVRCRDTNDGRVRFISVDTGAVDVDLHITECAIFGGTTVVNAAGRGVSILNSSIATFYRIFDISWPGEGGSPYHDDLTGQRAIRLANCRIHSMYKPGIPMITLRSGAAFGLHLIGNHIDRGECCLISAEDTGYMWEITGNVIHGMGGDTSASPDGNKWICLKSGINGLVLSDNSLVSGVDSSRISANVIYSEGAVSNLSMIGNTIKGTDGDVIKIVGAGVMAQCVVSGNVVDSAIEDCALISTDGNITMCAIADNIVTGSESCTIDAGDSITVTSSRVHGNYSAVDTRGSISFVDSRTDFNG